MKPSELKKLKATANLSTDPAKYSTKALFKSFQKKRKDAILKLEQYEKAQKEAAELLKKTNAELKKIAREQSKREAKEAAEAEKKRLKEEREGRG